MFDHFSLPSFLPVDWQYCKVRGKAPYEKGWENHPYSKTEIQIAIDKGECTGYGLITGNENYMAVDIDGIEPFNRMIELSGGILPDTVSWTSGKPNRMQLLFRLNRQQAMQLFFLCNKGRHFEDWGTEDSDSYEQLDFRFNGFQSVLPPSPHPDTGKPYEWINSPETHEVADAPDWLIAHIELIRDGKGHKAEKKRAQRKSSPISNGNGNGNGHHHTPQIINEADVDLIDFLNKDILGRLSIEQIYGPYMQLDNFGSESRGVCPLHVQADNPTSMSIDRDTKKWHCFACDAGGGPTQFLWQIGGGEGTPRGKDFIEIVRDLASRAGLEMPSKPKFSARELMEMWERDERDSKEGKEKPDKTPRKKGSFALKADLVDSLWSHRIRLNLLSHEVEFDGKPIAMDQARLKLSREGLDLGREDCWDIVLGIAKENAYNPVQEYLERIYKTVEPNHELLGKMSTTFLGTTEPLFDIYVRKSMIAAVARAYDPGCKLDTALVLQGGQGQNKSSFFEVLASEKWFDNSMGDTKDKDQLLKVHSSWWIEWAELETIFGKRDQSQVKAFMSTRIDNIRVPYGRQSEKMKRPSIICGTTNETDFLNDSSGNRRYWVIPVSCDRIDLKLLREQRDALWAASVDAYLKGRSQYEGNWYYAEHLYWLSPEEQRSSQELNDFFVSQHPWMEAVKTFVEFKTQVQASDVLAQIKPETADRTKADMSNVTDCLRKMGWTPARRRISGTITRVWIAPQSAPVNSSSKKESEHCEQPVTPPGSPVATPQSVAGQGIQKPVNSVNGQSPKSTQATSSIQSEPDRRSHCSHPTETVTGEGLQDVTVSDFNCSHNVHTVHSNYLSIEELDRDIESVIDNSLCDVSPEEVWHEV